MSTHSLSLTASPFEFTPEYDDFLDLFPHRGSFLWAEHPAEGERPKWKTETRHLLTDRLIKQGSYLYGVRFGSHTHYLMLDIDRSSRYHPCRDPFAVGRILTALEPLGLVRYLAASSSYSGGIHLYFPFMLSQPSWAIARAATILLENAGFKPHRGQLELFPNNRLSFGADYNGHRLPLQLGSYLLNSDWQPIYSSHEEFVRQWRLAQGSNPVRLPEIERLLKQHDRCPYRRIKGLAQKFLNDLNAEIELGWTGFGQTNRLLGKIAQREYIFFHAIHGGSPLTGDALAAQICAVAESLPGFEQWCKHQNEMVSLCRHWGRCVELSNYYPYGGKHAVTSHPTTTASWNQQQADEARERIRLAVAQLLEAGELPKTIRSRHLAIKFLAKVSSDTLYKNKDLWHGEIELKPLAQLVIQPDRQKEDDAGLLEGKQEGVIQPGCTNKLSPASVPAPSERETEGSSIMAVGEREGVDQPTGSPLEGVAFVRSILQDIERRQRKDRVQRALASPEMPPDERWFQPLLAGLNSE